MTKEQKIIRAKVGLLELAKQLGNVSQACKMLGYSRDSFYQFKELYDKGGDLALAEMSRRKPILANRTSPEIEAQIVALSLEQPAFGQIRVANEMRKRGLEYCLFKRPAQHASDLMRLMSWRISCCIAKLILRGSIRPPTTKSWSIKRHYFATAILLPADEFTNDLWSPTLDGLLALRSAGKSRSAR
jgi:Winged helix-turn helix